MNLKRFGYLFAVLLLLVTGVAYGQNGTITGTVTDTLNSALPLAKVTVANSATGTTRTIMTNSTGLYSLPNLPPGTYKVSVAAQGFADANYTGVILTVGQTLSLDVRLALGSVTQEVNVSSEGQAPIELDTSQLSNIVDSQTIQSLPLITRDPYSLVLLSPGTVQATSSLGGFSVNGARERNNNFLLDGVDNNDTSVPGIPSGISQTNPDAVSEYRVITNNFEAQYGRNTGAIIDVITMGGTNKFHGDAYWFGRYNALGARDWFNPKELSGESQKQNPYVRNIFGGSIGGPIKRDRSFFFFNFDLQRFRTTQTATQVVPTAAFKSGQFTYEGSPVDLTNAKSADNINGLTVDPQIQKTLALAPNPNAGLIDDARGQYQFPSSSRADQNVFTVRGDHKIKEGQNLMVRYVYNKFSDPNPFFDDVLPGLGSISSQQKAHNGTIQLNSVFGSHLTNQLSGGYNLTDAGFFCNGTSTFDAITGVDPSGRGVDYTIPDLFTSGCGTLGDANGQDRLTGTMMFVEALTAVKGRHTMRFGGEYRLVREDGYDDFGTRTLDTFNVFTNNPNSPAYNTPTVDPTTANYQIIQDMIYGLAGVVQQESVTQNFDKTGNPIDSDFRRYRQHEYAFYAQDSWKALPRLNINLGLRWEFYGVPFETNNNLTQLFAPANTTDLTSTFTAVGPGTGKQLYSSDFKLFQPRLGFSYDLLGNGKIAIRGGGGSFNDRIFGNLFGNSRSNPPFQQLPTNILNGSATLATVGFIPTVQTSPTLGQYSFASVSLIDPKLKQQASYNWNFGFQAEIFKDLVVESDYVGAHGLHILRVYDGNAPDPALTALDVAYCRNPNNAYGCVETATQSTIQGTLSWFGNTFGALPYDEAHNTTFFEPGMNTGIASSSYNALETIVTKRFTHGFNLRAAHTWAHGLDNAGDPIAPGGEQRSFPRDSNRIDLEHGSSDSDVKHRIVIDGTYELPVGTGKAALSHGIVGKALQGISISSIATAQSGQPVDLFGNRDSLHQGLSERLNLTGNPYPGSQGVALYGKRTGPSFTAFSLAPFDTAPTVGRNKFRGPNFTNIDGVFQKDTSFERFHVLLRVESYNVLNHPQFALPGNAFTSHDPTDPNLGGSFGISQSTVGRSDGTTSARQIQAAMKVVF